MIIINNTKSPIATTHEEARYTLKPGVNDVPPNVWAAWRTTKVMAFMIEEGKVKEPEAGAPNVEEAELGDTVPDLSKLSITKSCELVRATFDQELLEKWITDESREKVLKAMEKQLEKIAIKAKDEGAKKPAGEDNTDDVTGDDEAETPAS